MAYLEMAKRDDRGWRDVLPAGEHLPLGAAALAATPVRSTAPDRRELGFEASTTNSLDAVSDRDSPIEFSAAASLILVHLSRPG